MSDGERARVMDGVSVREGVWARVCIRESEGLPGLVSVREMMRARGFAIARA